MRDKLIRENLGEACVSRRRLVTSEVDWNSQIKDVGMKRKHMTRKKIEAQWKQREKQRSKF